MNQTLTLQHRVWMFSIVLAPSLALMSNLIGNPYGLDETSGWLGVLAFTSWIVAFHGLFGLTSKKFSAYAVLGLVIAVYAAVAGTNFSIDGMYLEAIGIDTVAGKNEFHSKFGIGGLITMYLPGIMFPLSLIVLGFMLRQAGILPWAVAILFILAGIGFPISRIPRIPALIHADNILLLISHILVAFYAGRAWRKSG